MSDNVTTQSIISSLNTLIPLFTFILGLLGKVFYDLWRDNYIDKRQRRKQALKIHFKRLEEQYIKPTIEFLENTTVQNGIVMSDSTETRNSIDLAQTTWPTENSKIFQSFKTHFPKEASALLELEKDTKENNDSNKAINTELVSFLEKNTNIPVNDYVKRVDTSFASFNPLIITFIRFSRHEKLRIKSGDMDSSERKFDFHDIGFTPNQFNKNKINVHLKDGRVLAEVNNIDEAEACKKVLIDITEDNMLMDKVRLNEADYIKKSLMILSYLLNNVCEIYGNFGSILKKKKKCPICRDYIN